MSTPVDKAKNAASEFERLIKDANSQTAKVQEIIKSLEQISGQADAAADGVASDHGRRLKGLSINLTAAKQALTGISAMVSR